MSTKGNNEANGHHVPFIPGYDSDNEDEYEPIVESKRAPLVSRMLKLACS